MGTMLNVNFFTIIVWKMYGPTAYTVFNLTCDLCNWKSYDKIKIWKSDQFHKFLEFLEYFRIGYTYLPIRYEHSDGKYLVWIQNL